MTSLMLQSALLCEGETKVGGLCNFLLAPWLLYRLHFFRWFPGYRIETLVTERGGREIGKLLNGLTWWEIRADVSDDLIQ